MKAVLEDTWLRKDATAAMRRSLNAHVRDPSKARVPVEYRKDRYGVGDRWMVVWYPPDGQRRRRKFASHADAEAFMAGLEDDIRSGRYVDPRDGERLIGRVGDEAFARLNHVKDATWNRYRRDWEAHVAPFWGGRPLSALTPAAVSAWVASLADGSADSCHRSPLAPSSIKGVRVALSIAVGYARRNRWLASDPLEGVSWPKVPRVSGRVYLTMDQVDALARAASRIPCPKGATAYVEGAGTTVLFLAYTGLRLGEALALCVSDVDLRHMRVSVSRTLTTARDSKRETIGTPKSGRSRRVPVPMFLKEPLKRLMAGHAGSDPLFRSPRGGRWSETNWRNRVWRPALAAAGLDRMEGLTPHSLRHTYASLAIANGADVKTLQNAMGHSSAAMTLDIYADLWPDRLDDVTAAIERAYARHGGSLGAVNAVSYGG